MSYEDIRFEDITFVIQGPVSTTQDKKQYASSDGSHVKREMPKGLTERAIANIRQHFPGSSIIVSTWEGQPAESLDSDLTIYSEDPGPNIVHYTRKDDAVYENMNRQIVSTSNGLKKVQTKYAVKFRSDNLISSNTFIGTYKSYQKFGESRHRIFKQRILTSDMWALDFIQGWPVPFFLSDFFHFGLTEDLLKLWDLPLFEDYPFNRKLKGRRQHRQYPWPMFSAEQAFVARFLEKNTPYMFKHKFDLLGNKKALSNTIIANNFLILEAPEISLEVPQRITHEHTLYTNFYSHFRWQTLYKKYCDQKLEINGEKEYLRQFSKVRFMKMMTRGHKVLFRLIRCWLLEKLGQGNNEKN